MRRHSTYEKVMTILLGMMLIVVLSFFLRAVVSPQMSFEASVEIAAPAEDVWPHLVVEDERIKWQVGVRTVVSLMGDDVMVGSRSVMIKKIGAKQWEIEEEIIDYLEGQTIVMVHSAEHYVEDIVVVIEPNGAGVELSYSSNKVYSGFLDNVLAPWSAYNEKQALITSLAILKRQVEASLS